VTGSDYGRIVVSGLTKTYRDVRAVDDLSFTVEPGRITGFLGPNGAGKTTTLRVMVGLIRPTAGFATISGRRYADMAEPARHVGALLEATSAHKARTGLNHLRVVCAALGLPNRRATEVIDLTGLDAAADRPFRGYSLGMRQRLGIATALLGDPQVLVLDEPSNGLDPEGIKWMREFLRQLADDGRTILVSSHLLKEMQVLSDDVIIIANGRLVRQASAFGWVSSGERPAVRVRTPDAATLMATIETYGGRAALAPDGSVGVTGMTMAAIGAAAFAAGIELHELSADRVGLEDVFLTLTHGQAAIR
jgi:ABC-2 type transport system ATP-binding protein